VTLVYCRIAHSRPSLSKQNPLTWISHHASARPTAYLVQNCQAKPFDNTRDFIDAATRDHGQPSRPTLQVSHSVTLFQNRQSA
jgi:hypothetical protein